MRFFHLSREVLIITIILRTIDILFQSLGIYLLTLRLRLDQTAREKINVQPLYLLNLSVTELVSSILWMCVLVIELTHGYGYYVRYIMPLLVLAVFVFAQLSYVLTMFSLTIDRLAAVKLSVNYKTYWDRSKAKRLIGSIWCVSGSVFMVVAALHKLTGFDFSHGFNSFVFTPLNLLFILLSTVTYAYIFNQYTQSIRSLLRSGLVQDKRMDNSWNSCLMFLRSKFKITFIIVVSFIFCQALPTILFTLVKSVSHTETEPSSAACAILYPIGTISDCCVYIFLQPRIRRIFLLKVCRRHKGRLSRERNRCGKRPADSDGRPQKPCGVVTLKDVQKEIAKFDFAKNTYLAIHEAVLNLYGVEYSLTGCDVANENV